MDLGERRCRQWCGIKLGVQILGRCPELGDHSLACLLIGEHRDVALQQLELLLPCHRESPSSARDDLTDLDVGGAEVLEKEPKPDRGLHADKWNIGLPQPGLEVTSESSNRPVAVEQRIDAVDLQHLSNP